MLQPKMGFELEIPVTFLTEKKENVATKMAYAENDYYKIEGDKSGVAGQMKGLVDVKGEMKEVTYNPTILELVTKAFDEHAADGVDKLVSTLDAVETFRAILHGETSGYTRPTTLEAVAKKLRLPIRDEHKNYIINAPAATPRTKEPNTAYAHFTVGISLDAIPRAAEWLMGRSIEDYPGIQTHKDVQDLMTALEKYIDRTYEDFQTEEEFFPDPMHPGQVKAFIYLAATHVQAIKRHKTDRVEGGGTSKNYTAFLSRSSFHNIEGNLSATAKKYLAKHRDKIFELIRAEIGPVSAEAREYLNDIFTKQVTSQIKYFGGMVTRAVERTGAVDSGLSGPPVEIRGLGTDLTEEGLREVAGTLISASRGQFLDSNPKSAIVKDSLFVQKV